MNKGVITLTRLLLQALGRYANRVAISTSNGAVSYRELRDQSAVFAAVLTDAGVKSGDRVGILLDNSIEYAVADLAIMRTHAVKVPMTAMLSAEETAYIVEHAETRVLIVQDRLVPLLPADTSATVFVVGELPASSPLTLHSWTSALASNNGAETAEPPDTGENPALLMYTGGTTGLPKGVLHTQSALGMNLLAHVISLEIEHNSRLLVSTPLPHSAGFLMQACLAQGGTVYLSRRFDPESLLATVERERITSTFLVPTMLYRLLDSPMLAHADVSSLRTIIYGAAPINPTRLQQGIDRFGPVFLQLYAQTECPNIATTLCKEDHLIPELQRSCGQQTLTAQVRVADPDTGCEVPLGDVGEVQLKSPYTMSEYYREPEKTRDAYCGDWLRTGDLGYQLASGHFFLVDRSKDMIISGGLNVYSSEVEAVLNQHPDIDDVAVIGVPHADWGEAVHAVIVSKSDACLSPQHLRTFCETKLASYKVPKSASRIEQLPVTKFGKTDKKALRDQFWPRRDRAIN